MKSNIEYLKEAIKNGTDTEEWIDAIEDELNKGTEVAVLKQEIADYESDIKELEQEVSSLKEDWIDPDNLKTIDCGVGGIKYIQPDNLKLQLLMEEFAEKHKVQCNKLVPELF